MASELVRDLRWLALAQHISSWSKDQSTQVGCVVVGSANQVLSLGYNGFPRGVNDTLDDRHERPLKYKWTEHAERNAVYNAARTGTSLNGSTLYVPFFPCADCARAIIQSGIKQVVSPLPSSYSEEFTKRWSTDFKISHEMFAEALVTVRYVN